VRKRSLVEASTPLILAWRDGVLDLFLGRYK